MALTKGQFLLYETVAKLQAALIKNDKRVELTTGERYLTAAVNSGGLLLASGNYANPLNTGVFGTAAYADLTTSPTDTTVGRVLKVGDVINAGTLDSIDSTQFLRSDTDSTITGSFLADDPATTTDWNANWQTGFYDGNGAANAPTAGWYWGLKSGHRFNHANNRYGMDLVMSTISEIPYIRSTIGNGTGTWQQIHTTGSLAFLQNQSGGTIGSTATVAGSSLLPTQAGTWRNVSGGNILNNGWGLWGIV